MSHVPCNEHVKASESGGIEKLCTCQLVMVSSVGSSGSHTPTMGCGLDTWKTPNIRRTRHTQHKTTTASARRKSHWLPPIRCDVMQLIRGRWPLCITAHVHRSFNLIVVLGLGSYTSINARPARTPPDATWIRGLIVFHQQ